MEISRIGKCIKLHLPNGKVVDVLDSVIEEICKWIQDDDTKPESGGYIVGYQHEYTGNITLEKASPPFDADKKSRIHFAIKDKRHRTCRDRWNFIKDNQVQTSEEGQIAETGHDGQSGLAWHTTRPWRFRAIESLDHIASGKRSLISFADLFLSSVSVKPRRFATRTKWVSAMTAGLPRMLCI